MTNAFSKKIESHLHILSLNFVRITFAASTRR